MGDSTVRLLFLGDASSAVRSVRTLDGSFGGLGRAAKTAQLALASLAVGGIAFAIKEAASFEKTLNVLQATSGATARDMKTLAAEAKRLGADTKLPATSARDAAEAMLELSKGGLSVNQVLKATRGVLQLSTAAQISNAEAAKITARALNAFSLAGEEASHVADVLANAAVASTGEINDFALGLQQSSALAKSYGLSIEETVGALMRLADAGIVGSDAGTLLKRTLQTLEPTTDRAAALMDKLGLHTVNTRDGQLKLNETIALFTEKLMAIDPVQRRQIINTLAGSDAARAWNILLTEGAGKQEKATETASRHGTAQKIAEAQTKGLSGAIEGLKSAASTLAITLGTELLPHLTEGVKKFSAWASELAENEQAQRQLEDAIRFTVSALRDMAAALKTVADLVGGWDELFKLLITGFLVGKVVGLAGGFKLLAGAGGIGGANTAALALRSNLLGIAAIGSITIRLRILADEDVPSWVKALIIGQISPLGAAIYGGKKLFGGDDDKDTGAGFTGVVPDPRGKGGGLIPNRAVLAPGADRPGVATKTIVTDFVSRIAEVMGADRLVIGTGTRHNQMTTSGNVSQHWTGNAADIPASGETLTRMGQAALIAAGADPAWAKRQRGGLYNIGGFQIIFNSNIGGNHFNHLHVGIRDGTEIPGSSQPSEDSAAARSTDTPQRTATHKIDLSSGGKKKAKATIDLAEEEEIQSVTSKLAFIGARLDDVPARIAARLRTRIGEIRKLLGGIVTEEEGQKAGRQAENLMGQLGRAINLQKLYEKAPDLRGAIKKALVDGIVTEKELATIRARFERIQDALKEMVDEIGTLFGDAAGNVIGRALSVFDAQTDAFRTPTEKIIAAEEKAREEADIQRRLAAAREQGDAQGEADILYEIRRRGLEAQAAEERKQYEAERAEQRAAFEAEYAALIDRLQRGKTTTAQAQRDILALLKKHGIDYEQAGDLLGTAFAAGMEKAIDRLTRVLEAFVAALAGRAAEAKKILESLEPAGGTGGGGGPLPFPTPFAGPGGHILEDPSLLGIDSARRAAFDSRGGGGTAGGGTTTFVNKIQVSADEAGFLKWLRFQILEAAPEIEEYIGRLADDKRRAGTY